MPFYFYHLKLELYSSPTPTSDGAWGGENSEQIWLPFRHTDIFGELPSSHEQTSLESSRPILTLSDLRDPLASGIGIANTERGKRSDNIIECGIPRRTAEPRHVATREALSRRSFERTPSPPPPQASAALEPQIAVKDWRFGRVNIVTIDPLSMTGEPSKAAGGASASAAPSLGPTLGGAGRTSRAEFIPVRTRQTDVGWGIVHFYRDGDETPSLGALRGADGDDDNDAEGVSDDLDCTTVCIPAVPAYMSPGDFLGFVGEKWRGDISHCRMIMTSNMNKYLTLLKFRDSHGAKKWRQEFDGKVFNTMEPQVCHAVFVKDITFETPTQPDSSLLPTAASSSSVSNTLKPFPPPTPNLIELPTCPVCLERMDETNGLMTIPCSHVFHCTCLQNWKGAGCPVCRFTSASQEEEEYDPDNPFSQPFGSSISNLCSVCDSDDDLWICLICGRVGCGRYKGGHAKDHWKETAHSFALELETQHVWDYAGDMWVHRLIRDKGDGKVVELPGRNSFRDRREDEDVVPRAKLDSIGLEYTHLITSQLESQRAYYEDLIKKTVDKASKAAATAESAAAQSSMAMEKLTLLDAKYSTLTRETIPHLERDLEREKAKATKSQDLARNLSKSVQEEKRINEGLLKRIEHINEEGKAVQKRLEELTSENAELKEMNRDLSMFISGQEKLKEMESEGQVGEGEIEGGTASVPEKKGKRRGKR